MNPVVDPRPATAWQSTRFCILHVEDDDNDAALVHAALGEARQEGAEVLRARSLAEALATLRARDVDLALVDLDLPDSAGFDTLEQVRALARGAVVVVSGNDQPSVVMESLRRKASDVLSKDSLGSEVLMRVVRLAAFQRGAEHPLQAARNRERLLVEQAPVAIFIRCGERYVYANPAALRLAGATRLEQITGRPALEFIHPEDRAAVRERARRTHVDGVEVPAMRLRFLRLDGGTVVVESQAVPFEYDGQPAAQVVMQDIAARVELEDRVSATFDRAPVGIAHVGRDGRILVANARLSAMLGRPRAALIGMHVGDLSHPEDRHATAEPRARLLAGECDEFALEKRYLRSDGSVLWASVTVTALRDAGGRYRYDICVIQDVTARRESERRYHAVVEGSPDAIFIHDGERVLMANPAALRLFGAAEEAELLGRSMVSLISPADRAAARARITALLRGEPVPPMEQVYLRLDGTGVDVEVRATPLVFGGAATVQVVARDISDRKRAEVVLRENEERFRSLTAISSDGYWEQDEQFRFNAVSGGAQWDSQDQPAALLGRCRWEAPGLVPGSADWDVHRALLEAHQPFRDFTYERLDAEGRVRIISVSGVPVLRADGSFAGYRGTATDVTEKRRTARMLALEHEVARALAGAERASHAIREVLRAVCESQRWALGRCWMPDAAGEMLRVKHEWSVDDPAVRRYLEGARGAGFRRGAGIPGAVWASGEPLWVPDLAGDGVSTFTSIVSETGLRGAFMIPVVASGAVIGVLGFAAPAIGRPDEHLLATGRTVGRQLGQYLERKRGERALRASNERFEIVARATNDVVWDWDLVTDRVWWNENIQSVFGYRRDAISPYSDTWSGAIDPRDLVRVRAEMAAVLESGGSDWAGEYRFRRADGSVADVFDRAHLIRDAGGKPLRMIGAITDISQRKAAERQARAHARRQESIARFGRAALGSVSMAALYEEAVETLKRHGADVAAVLEMFTDTGEFGVIAARGEGTEDNAGRRMVTSPDSIWSRLFAENRTHIVGREYLGTRPVSAPWRQWIHRMRSAVYAPVQVEGRPLALIAMYAERDHAFGEDDRAFAESMSSTLSAALQRRKAEERAASHARRQQAVAEFGQLALSAADAGELYAQAVGYLCAELVEDAVVYERAPAQDAFTARAARGARASACLGITAPVRPDCKVLEALGTGRTATSGRAYLMDRSPERPWGWCREMGGAVYVPVAGEGGPFGVLAGYRASAGPFADEDVRFAEAIAHVLSSAVKRTQAEQRLAYLARFDALTGLPNRSLLQDRLEQVLVQAPRHGVHAAVLFVDLDRFKLVNDTLGHVAGDALIRMVAGRLAAAVRPGDTVGRISGDEFAIVCADLAAPDDAALVAKKVLDALAQPFQIDAAEAFVTASVGIAIYPNDGADAATLVKCADMAMYRAKESGRNAYAFYTPEMNARSVQKLQLQTDLRHALDRDEFRLYYQPKVRLETGELCGMEALLRWRHPQRGMVSPAEFIPALEESGLIVEVGDWVVCEAVSQLAAWRAAGLATVPVAVNLSARQFRRRDLDRFIRDCMAREGIPRGMLEVEITESSLMEDPEDAVRMMRNLREAGVGISVDDFGTGYSSLQYLTRLPISSLKVDRSFVSRAQAEHSAAAIVRAIIDMAHNLGFIVVAEGIETDASVALLRQFGCEQGQGYFFGRPVPADEVRARLAPAGA